MEPALFVIGFVLLALLVRLIAGGFDGERVEAYVREKGWQLIDRSWAPFGPGWFGEQDARIYSIVYRDSQGRSHKAHVKTSMFGGVYLTEDHIVETSEPPPLDSPRTAEEVDLAAENARLKARIAELEQGGG